MKYMKALHILESYMEALPGLRCIPGTIGGEKTLPAMAGGSPTLLESIALVLLFALASWGKIILLLRGETRGCTMPLLPSLSLATKMFLFFMSETEGTAPTTLPIGYIVSIKRDTSWRLAGEATPTNSPYKSNIRKRWRWSAARKTLFFPCRRGQIQSRRRIGSTSVLHDNSNRTWNWKARWSSGDTRQIMSRNISCRMTPNWCKCCKRTSYATFGRWSSCNSIRINVLGSCIFNLLWDSTLLKIFFLDESEISLCSSKNIHHLKPPYKPFEKAKTKLELTAGKTSKTNTSLTKTQGKQQQKPENRNRTMQTNN